MERLTMQSELLIELSDEQQEVVSGGDGGLMVDDLIKTGFKELTEDFAFAADVVSGKEGSRVQQKVGAKKMLTITDALKDFSIDFGSGGGIKIS